MRHPLADRLRQTQSRVGAPLAPLVPFILQPTSGDLVGIIDQIGDAQNEAENLSIPGIDPTAMKAKVIDAFLSGGADPKAFLQDFFSMGAAIACTAIGSPALAPLCAASGAVIGEAVAGFQVQPVGPGSTPSADALAALLTQDSKILQEKRDGLFFSLAARFNSAPQAMKQVEAILADFFSGVGCFAPMPDGQCVYYKGTKPCLSGSTPAWTNNKGECSTTALPAYGGGFSLPFYVLNGCALIGKNYHDLCGQYWEWELDYSYASNAQQKASLKPDWLPNLLTVMQGILMQNNIDVTAAFNALRSKSWPTSSPAETLSAVYIAVRNALWPALQIALEKRLKAVVVEVAVKANEKLVLGVDALVGELVRRTGCKDDTCKKQLQNVALKIAQDTTTADTKKVVEELDRKFPDLGRLISVLPPLPPKEPPPSPLRPVVALGGTAVLLYVLHRLIKRYV